jgi:long-chain acyl-CoA synthetase
MNMQLRDILPRHEASATAILCEDWRLSYAELESVAVRFSNLFGALGLASGERVSLLLGNDPLTVAAIIGAFKAGVVANPLHDRLSSHEIGYILDHAGSKLVVTSERFAGVLGHALTELENKPLMLCFGVSDGLSSISKALFYRQSEKENRNANPSGDDDALLLYTSGTTGRPKGVLLSHDNVLYGGISVRDRFKVESSDRTLCVMPLSHTNALMFSTIPFLMAGASLALRPRFSASSFWEECRKYAVNSASVSPAILAILLDTYSGESLDGIDLDYIKVASAPTSVELARRFEAQFGEGLLLETYGMTETTAISLGNPVDGPRKYGSIGTACLPHRVKIIDDAGMEVPSGEVGEISIGGPSVMKGYFRDPAATAAVMRDGWVMSGDLARMDEEGYVFIVGRKKEIIIRGGENVSPLEVEQVISHHPAVGEAAAIGIPDRILGEAVGACVVRCAEVSESELIAFCATRLASFKVPQKIVFIDELPRNVIGKLVRGALAKHFPSKDDEVHA